MKRPTQFARLAVLALVGSLALAGCGSDDSGDDKTASDDKSSTGAKKGDGTLTIGTLLPQTGDLAFLGPPEFAGVQLAVDDINAAGGVNGKKVVQSKADSGDGTPDIAGAEVDKLLAAKSDVIVGAAASGVSVSVIDKITGSDVVQFSPANTAAGFDTYDDNGLYFRTAPSDILQGEILANRIVEDDHSNVAIMGRQDFYGEGLSKRVEEVLKEKGATVSDFTLYSADAQNFTAEVNKVAASKPDAIVLVSFNETSKIIPQLIAKGYGPKDVQIYFVDGNLSDSYKGFDLTGVIGTSPAPASPNAELIKRLKQQPGVSDTLTYGAESYDAVIISALAAVAGKDDSGTTIGANIVDVTREGTKCTEFKECADLLAKGEDIDYDGKSGAADMTDSGSLVAGSYGIYEYKKGNKYDEIDNVSGVVPQSN
ncbi:amino acid ABC transporter substrate-binding protein [Nocardioides sp. Root140]|nr:amino acid ABC transporter substrate-binding protein [Nocardioides sp. Root140]